MPYLGVRVPSGTVGSTLTDFPVYIDLSTVPASFWSQLAHDDGGDIRCKTGIDVGSTDLPFDIVFINADEQTGTLFVKVPSLASGADNDFYLHFGNAANTLPAVGAGNGRNAVWTDYHRVYFFSPTDGFEDHTGNGSAAVPTGSVSAFQQTDISGQVNSHQGVAYDGTHYYTVDTNVLRKWTAAWSLVTSNTDPAGDVAADVGFAINHCGDPEVKDGVLYVPCQIWPAGGSGSNPYVARFSASTLAYIDAVSLAAPTDASAICYVPTEDVFVVTSFFGSTLYTLNPTTLAAVDTVPLSTTVTQVQGVTWWCGRLWITSDGLAAFGVAGFKTKRLFSVAFDGTVTGQPALRYDAATDSTDDYLEGLSHDDEGLLVIRSTASVNNGRVYKLEPNPRRRGGARLAGANTFSTATGYLKATGLTRYTTWTIGLDVAVGGGGTTESILSYTTDASTDDTVRSSFGWRQSTNRLGIWNNADGWVESGSAPTPGVVYQPVRSGELLRVLHGADRDRDDGLPELRPADADHRRSRPSWDSPRAESRLNVVVRSGDLRQRQHRGCLPSGDPRSAHAGL
jgi:hypothetical protein